MVENQPFERGLVRYYLLIESSNHGVSKFWLRRSKDDDEENDGYYAEQIDMPVYFESSKADELPARLVEELRVIGFAATSYEELARETFLLYSYVDKTPGTTQEEVCLHVTVDATENLNSELISMAPSALLGHLDEFLVNDHVVRTGIRRLTSAS